MLKFIICIKYFKLCYFFLRTIVVRDYNTESYKQDIYFTKTIFFYFVKHKQTYNRNKDPS